MDDWIENVVILGAGTAGWITAAYRKALQEKVKVSALESPTVPRIGVGKASIPHLTHKPESVVATEPLFEEVKRRQRHLAEELPSNYDYLRSLHAH